MGSGSSFLLFPALLCPPSLVSDGASAETEGAGFKLELVFALMVLLHDGSWVKHGEVSALCCRVWRDLYIGCFECLLNE